MKDLMPTRRTMLGVSALGLIASPAAGTDGGAEASRAPFGLTWAMSSDDAKKLGATLTPMNDQGRWGKSFSAVGLGRMLSDTETVLLSFGFRDRLFRIAAIGRSHGLDPYGGAVLSRYTELSRILAERYGPGRETDLRDTQVWKAPNEYIMSLRQGRAHRFTMFSSPAVEVELSVRATDANTAYYVIIFMSRAGSTEFEADKRQRERDSL